MCKLIERILTEEGVSPKNIEQIFEIAEEDLSVKKLRHKTTKKYLTFFNHYQWYTLLCAFYAGIGLYLTIENWEETFVPAYRMADDPEMFKIYAGLSNALKLMCLCTTFVAILVCFWKHQAK